MFLAESEIPSLPFLLQPLLTLLFHHLHKVQAQRCTNTFLSLYVLRPAHCRPRRLSPDCTHTHTHSLFPSHTHIQYSWHFSSFTALCARCVSLDLTPTCDSRCWCNNNSDTIKSCNVQQYKTSLQLNEHHEQF